MAAASNPATAEETIHGLILRTSASFSGRYAYFPFPPTLPTAAGDPNLDATFSDSLAAAPHFPNITIFDSISSTILYQTYNSFPDFFHVYNLIDRRHFPIPFPSPFPHLAAGIAIHECIHFKILVVCAEEHSNPFFAKAGDDDRGSNPIAFYIYSSQHRNWSRLRHHFSALTSDQLLPTRKNPVHAGEDVVYLDLTDRFLFRFAASTERVDPIPKLVSSWERNSIKIDESARYGECKGMLHCAKFNPVSNRVEIYVWMDPPNGLWRLMAVGREGNLEGRVIGINPNDANSLFIRSKVTDSISMVHIQRDLEGTIVGGRGAKCGEACLLKGMNGVLEAALEGGRKLERSGCGVVHPHENDEGPEGEIFIVSRSGTRSAAPK